MRADMRVDHGRAKVLVPEQFLNRADVGPVFEQVSSETMAQGVATDVLSDTGATYRGFECLLQGRVMDVVASNLGRCCCMLGRGSIHVAWTGVGAQLVRGKDELPMQLPPGFWVFFRQCVRQPHPTCTGIQVSLVLFANLFNLFA